MKTRLRDPNVASAAAGVMHQLRGTSQKGLHLLMIGWVLPSCALEAENVSSSYIVLCQPA